MTSEYGTYRITYTPPEERCLDYPSISIDMATPGDASVSEMLRFFEAFLSAAGYILKGDLVIEEPTPEVTSNYADYSFNPFQDYGTEVKISPSAFSDVLSFTDNGEGTVTFN